MSRVLLILLLWSTSSAAASASAAGPLGPPLGQQPEKVQTKDSGNERRTESAIQFNLNGFIIYLMPARITETTHDIDPSSP